MEGLVPVQSTTWTPLPPGLQEAKLITSALWSPCSLAPRGACLDLDKPTAISWRQRCQGDPDAEQVSRTPWLWLCPEAQMFRSYPGPSAWKVSSPLKSASPSQVELKRADIHQR